MTTNKERSTRAALKARRQALLRELAGLEKQIIETEQAKTRLEERITVLGQGQRQAA